MDLVFQLIPIVASISVVAVYIKKIRTLIVEVSDVLHAVDSMMDDNRITKEEITKIKNESIDVWNAIKAFKKK